MGLDSVDLLIEIEKAFKIKIQNHEAEQIVTVKDYYDIVWNHLSDSKEKSNKFTREEAEFLINQIIIDKTGVEKEEVIPSEKLCEDLGTD
jgi:acyl carrier protein